MKTAPLVNMDAGTVMNVATSPMKNVAVVLVIDLTTANMMITSMMLTKSEPGLIRPLAEIEVKT